MAAFDANAIAYLLKPIERERLSEMVERAWRLHQFAGDRAEVTDQIHRFTAGVPRNFQQIVARKLDPFLLFDPAEVLYFYIHHLTLRARITTNTISLYHLITTLPH